MTADAILDVTGLAVSYGGPLAVQGVNFSVRRGEVTTLIGSNGAGKTTILRAITNLQRCTAGKVHFDGRDITNLPINEIVSRGISMVPEGRRLFGSMTVKENIRIGAFRRTDARIESDYESVLGYFPVLAERLDAKASSLSGGQQQMVAMARALMSAPRLLILDEPSVGLAPVIVKSIADIITRISATGVDILLVEQNAALALRISHYAYVVENGSILMHGPARDLENSEQVRSAYLGL